MAEDENTTDSPKDGRVGRDSIDAKGDVNTGLSDIKDSTVSQSEGNKGASTQGVNYGNISQSIKNFYGIKSENDLSDPTDDFPDTLIREYSEFSDFTEVDKQVSVLENNRILLISSPLPECSLTAAVSLVRYGEARGYQRRLLRLERHEGRINLDRLYTKVDNHKQKTLVMTELAEEEVVSLLPRTSSGFLHLRDGLQKANRCFLVVANSNGTAAGSIAPRIERWNVDFLPFLLRRAAKGQSDDVNDLIKLIRDQRQRRLWPQDDAEFYTQITTLLSKEWGEFTEDIRRDTDRTHVEPRGTKVLKAAEDRFASILEKPDNDRLLYLAALFIGCNFPEATPGDFNLLVNLVLDNEGAATRNWRDRSDTVLHRLGIAIKRTNSGREIIAFLGPEDRSTARVFLEQRHPLYRERQFERLMKADLIFQTNLSPAGVERAVKLLCSMMLAVPSRRSGLMNSLLDRLVADPESGLAWLQGSLAARCASLFDRDKGEQTFFQEIGRLFRPWRGPKGTSMVVRLSYLFVSLERTPELQHLAWQLLDHLKEKNQQALICDLLLQAAADPRFQPSEAFWRRLWTGLRDGDDLDRDRYYQFLAQYMGQLGQDIIEALREIHQWLPDPNVKTGNLSHPEKVALMCLHDFDIFQLSQITQDSMGEWPPPHPLLAAMANDEVCRRMLIEWVFHPGWRRLDQPLAPIWAVRADIGRGEANQNLMAALFINWLILLAGSKNGEADPRSVDLAKALLETAFRHFEGSPDRSRKQWFRDQLHEFRNDLLYLRGQAIADHDLRRWYDAQRNAVNLAIKDWNKLGAAA